MISVSCPHCAFSTQVSDSFAGQSGPCQQCRRVFQIPFATQVEAPTIMQNSGMQNSGMQNSGMQNSGMQAPSGSHASLPYSSTTAASRASGVLSHSAVSVESSFERLTVELDLQVLETLGEGGMGVVYRVHDKRLGRDAALKILKGQQADDLAKRRFIRESKITAQLDHPAIPPVYEMGNSPQGDLFLLMRVIEGETLQSKIRRYHELLEDPKTLRVLLNDLLKVSQAVAYAHSQDIIHRDLKPQNIMVGKFGEVMVMDWGLAKDLSYREDDSCLLDKGKELEEGEGLTQVGAVMGTLGYMSPEQAGNEDIDSRTDVFALGAILTEILTGRPPIVGTSNVNRMVATVKGQIETPLQRDASLSKELNAIAKMALAVELEERTASAADFLEDLQAYLAGEEISIYNYSLTEKAKRQAQKRPGLLLGAPIVALLLFTALFLSIQLTLTEDKLTRVAESAKVSEKKLSQTAEELTEREAALKQAAELEKLLNTAREYARRGKKGEKIQEALKQALAIKGRRYSALITAAEIATMGNERRYAKSLLEEACAINSKPYKALFLRHELILDEQRDHLMDSEPLKQLKVLASSVDKQNIYTRFALAQQSFMDKKYQQVIKLCDKIDGANKRIALVYFLRGVARIEQFNPKNPATEKLGERGRKDMVRALELKSTLPLAHYYQGLYYFQIGNGNEAEQAFKNCLDQNSKHAPSYFHQAYMRYSADNPSAALKLLDKSIDSDPNYSQAFSLRARIHLNRRDLQRSLADQNACLRINPKDANAFYRRANIYKNLGQIVQAHDDYGRALVADPKHPYALYYKMKINRQHGRYKEWLEDLDFAIRREPGKITHYISRAFVKGKLGDTEGAFKEYAWVIDKDTNNPEVYFERSKLFARLGRMAEAEADLSTAARLDKSYADKAASEKKKQQKQQKRFEEIAKLVKTLKNTSKDEKTLRKIAALKNKIGNRQGAVNDLKRAIELKPDSYKAHYELGKVLIDMGRPEQALPILTRGISIKDSYAKSHYRRGLAYLDLNRLEEAMSDFNAALKRDPKYTDCLEKRTQLLRHRGDMTGALMDAEAWIKAEPKSARAHFARAKAYFGLRKYDQYARDIRKAMELDPRKWDYARDLGYSYYKRGNFADAREVLVAALRNPKYKIKDMEKKKIQRMLMSAAGRTNH